VVYRTAASWAAADLTGTLQRVECPSLRSRVIYIVLIVVRPLRLDAERPSVHSIALRRQPTLSATADLMHFTNAIAAALLLAASASAWKPSSTKGTDKLARQGLKNLKRHHASYSSMSSCTIGKAAVRKEWLSLSDKEKTAYITAVQCLMDKPSITGDAAPGAKSRYDDFVAVHINQTLSIHATVSASPNSGVLRVLMDARATSYLGTDTSHGSMSVLCARSVVTRGTSHTSTGESTLTTSSARRFSMVVRPPWAVMESTSPTTALEFPPTKWPISSFHQETDLDVSPAVLSRT